MNARMSDGPTRYSTRKVSMDGSCVGLRRACEHNGVEPFASKEIEW